MPQKTLSRKKEPQVRQLLKNKYFYPVFQNHHFDKWLINPNRVLIQGILNVTPDSFSDGGLYSNPKKAFDKAMKLLKDGCDIIDIGGESSRPGSNPISVQEELDRVIPVIEKIKNEVKCLISVDTYKADVASEAIKYGANIVNDITGLTNDPDMIDLVVKNNIPVILMHMQGKPKSMQKNPFYHNVIDEISTFFSEQIRKLDKKGFPLDKIILDPGIGFGKTLQHNLKILKNVDILCNLGCHTLIGTSRKSFIGDILNCTPDKRLEGTISSNLFAIIKGVKIVRVHDVLEMRKALTVFEKILEA